MLADTNAGDRRRVDEGVGNDGRAGTRGPDIAQICARGGFRTILEDILPASLRRAESEIHSAFDLAFKVGELTPAEVHAALACIEYASSVEQPAREADLVIEAVPDELESKTVDDLQKAAAGVKPATKAPAKK